MLIGVLLGIFSFPQTHTAIAVPRQTAQNTLNDTLLANASKKAVSVVDEADGVVEGVERAL